MFQARLRFCGELAKVLKCLWVVSIMTEVQLDKFGSPLRLFDVIMWNSNFLRINPL
jgi:hypothetical protein